MSHIRDKSLARLLPESNPPAGVGGFDWASAAARLLKSQIALEGITMATLAKRLDRLGVQETEAALRNKLYRGTFSLSFFMQCMKALGHSTVYLQSSLPEGPEGKALDRGAEG